MTFPSAWRRRPGEIAPPPYGAGGSLSTFVRAAISRSSSAKARSPRPTSSASTCSVATSAGTAGSRLEPQEVFQGKDACQASPLTLARWSRCSRGRTLPQLGSRFRCEVEAPPCHQHGRHRRGHVAVGQRFQTGFPGLGDGALEIDQRDSRRPAAHRRDHAEVRGSAGRFRGRRRSWRCASGAALLRSRPWIGTSTSTVRPDRRRLRTCSSPSERRCCDSRRNIAAIVLAAGRSTRMGAANKLLGRDRRQADGAARGGGGAGERGAAGAGGDGPSGGGACGRRWLDWRSPSSHNPDYAKGLSSSLKAGIGAVPDAADGALVLLGDMPQITAAHLDRLMAAFADDRGDAIIVPTHAGKRGNPVLWPRAYFAEMLQLEGDAGAKRLLAAHAVRVREVDLGTDAIFADVDTPEALARVARGSDRRLHPATVHARSARSRAISPVRILLRWLVGREFRDDSATSCSAARSGPRCPSGCRPSSARRRSRCR